MASLERVVTQNLRCSICLNSLTEPKLLSCLHNFCESCLTDLLHSQRQLNLLSCPICRHPTVVPDAIISNLPTNQLLKTIVSDVKGKGDLCDICDKEIEAKHYCCDCGKVMCTGCHSAHADHEVVVLNGINKIEEKVFCEEHAAGEEKQECTDVCITCKKYICTRCRLFKHERKFHTVKSNGDYEASLKKGQSVQGKTGLRTDRVREHIEFLKGEKLFLLDHIDSVKSRIEQTFVDSKRGNETAKLTVCERIDEIKIDVGNFVSRVSRDLLARFCESTAERNSVVGHVPLSCGEKSGVNTQVHTYSNLLCELRDTKEQWKYGERGEFKVNFVEKGQSGTWTLQKGMKLHAPNSMECMVATAQGALAVGCSPGGIQVFTSDGLLQERVLCDVNVRGLAVLSNGTFVVRDALNTVSLYTKGACEKLDVIFETQNDDEGGHGGLTVDNNDHIFVGYRKSKVIQVFTQAGGKVVRLIYCNGYEPMQIFSMNTTRSLIVKSSSNSILLVNESGVKEHELVLDRGHIVHPGVGVSDSILLAVLGRGCNNVCIKQYARDLRCPSTILANEVIEPTDRKWFGLQEIAGGKIAFCTPDRLYIFCKSVETG